MPHLAHLDFSGGVHSLSAMIRVCSACGVENRIPSKHLADQGRCGACKAPIMPLAEPLDVDAAAFADIGAHARVPILVDFWAPWCGPCRMVAPELKRVAHDLSGKALVLKVDTDRHPELAARFNVSGIPNFVVLKNSRVVRQQAGALDHRRLRAMVESSF